MPSGRPSVRFVLLKGVDDGFVFFTNYQSRKGDELAANPQGALCFGWLELERQVRVVGPVRQVAEDESDAYFASRPPGSQWGAWASDQSRAIADRADLEQPLGRGRGAVRRRVSPARRTGAATASCPTRSSSGRAGPAACTTASATPAPAPAWDVERLMP